MSNKQYIFVPPGTDFTLPVILNSGDFDNVTEDQLLVWREAKKELRQWYLDQARSLRNVSEKDYFEKIND